MEWVQRRFVEKLELRLDTRFPWLESNAESLHRLLDVLERLPDRDAIIARHPQFFTEFELYTDDESLRKRARTLYEDAREASVNSATP